MSKKVVLTVCFILMIFNVWCRGAGEKRSVLFSDKGVEGIYEIKYPYGLKNILYIKYFIQNGFLYTQQLWGGKSQKLEVDRKTKLSFLPDKDGYSHEFVINDNNKIDGVVVRKGKSRFTGNKLASIDSVKAGGVYSLKALKADFEQMVKTFKYLHPSVYDYTSENEMDKLIRGTGRKLNRPMNINEFYRIISPVLAKVGCGHSYLRLPSSYLKSEELRYLPFDVHLVEGRLVVTRVLCDEYKDLKGVELVVVNGKPVAELVAEMLSCQSSDWKNVQFRKYLLNRSFKFKYCHLYGSSEEYRLEYRRSGEPENRILFIKGMSGQSLRNVQNAGSGSGPLLLFYPAEDVAVLSIKHFEFYGKKAGKKFSEFVDKAFAEIREKEIQKLILDVRGNMGGDPVAAHCLLRYLIPKPFRYFEKLYGESSRGLYEEAQPAANRFGGELITLMDNGCYSTTGHLLALLKYHKAGKLAGVETGTTYSCTDGSVVHYLLNTNIWFKVARERFSVAVEGFSRSKGIYPDYKIDLTLEDLLDERDLQLESVIQLIK